MKSRSLPIAMLLLANCFPAISHAATVGRATNQMAAGACQPFAPTSAVRYNQSGISNVGTSSFYVVCSLAGTEDDSTKDITSYFEITVFNNSGTTQTTYCTARPGSVVGSTNNQLAAPANLVLEPSESFEFMWTADSFGNAVLPANANFTCVLNPGHSIQRIQFRHFDYIGN